MKMTGIAKKENERSRKMKNEVLCSAKILRCELLDVRPSALDYAIQDITHELTNSVMCELEQGELICSLENVEQHQLYDLNSVKIIRKVRIERLVRCKDCKYKPKWREGASEKRRDGLDLIFPELEENPCPCQCDDGYYAHMPDDNWFCANGKRKEQNDEE